MKLVPFTCAGNKIGVNPQHVVTVRAGDKGETVIFLATGGQLKVHGTVDEVTDKLCHDAGA